MLGKLPSESQQSVCSPSLEVMLIPNHELVTGKYASIDPTTFNRPGGSGTVASTVTRNYVQQGDISCELDDTPAVVLGYNAADPSDLCTAVRAQANALNRKRAIRCLPCEQSK